MDSYNKSSSGGSGFGRKSSGRSSGGRPSSGRSSSGGYSSGRSSGGRPSSGRSGGGRPSSGGSRSEGSSSRWTGSRRPGPERLDFTKQGRGESRGSRDSGSFRGKPKRQSMVETTCDKCGKDCSVPFKPTEGKPVYCSDCFRGHTEPSSPVKTVSYAKEFEKINDKLDKIMQALEIQ